MLDEKRIRLLTDGGAERIEYIFSSATLRNFLEDIKKVNLDQVNILIMDANDMQRDVDLEAVLKDNDKVILSPKKVTGGK